MPKAVKKINVTVRGIGKNITIYCENGHSEPIEMGFKDPTFDGYDVFYTCPKYYPQNRSEEERACNNNLTPKEFQKLIEKINEMVGAAELSHEQENLTNVRFKMGQIQCHILEHSPDGIKVGIVNKRAINK